MSSPKAMSSPKSHVPLFQQIWGEKLNTGFDKNK